MDVDTQGDAAHELCMEGVVLIHRVCALQEPCRSFVLRDIICAYCNFCTDLDLCRDPALQVGKPGTLGSFLPHPHF